MIRAHFDRLFDEQPYIPDMYIDMERKKSVKYAFDCLETNMLDELMDVQNGIIIGSNKERNKNMRHIIANLTQAQVLSRIQIWDGLLKNISSVDYIYKMKYILFCSAPSFHMIDPLPHLPHLPPLPPSLPLPPLPPSLPLPPLPQQ